MKMKNSTNLTNSLLILIVFLCFSCGGTKNLVQESTSKVEENLGVSRGGIVDNPATPEATDGTFEYKVGVQWKPVPSINTYTVYRSTKNTPSAAKEINRTQKSNLTTPSIFDYNVEPGVKYYYWIQSLDKEGTKSEWSSSDSGFIPNRQDLVTPATFQIDMNSYTNLEWAKVQNADMYRVQIITPEKNQWSSIDGFNEDVILLDTLVNANNMEWVSSNLPERYMWSVRAEGESGNSLFTDQQFVARDLLTSPKISSAIRIKSAKYNSLDQTIKVDFENNNQEEGLEMACFYSESGALDNNAVLLSKRPILSSQNQLTLEASAKQNNKGKYIIVPMKNGRLLKDLTFIL